MSDEPHVWTTADGTEVEAKHMETDHIRNALRVVQGWVDQGPPEYPMFQGETAQYYWDAEDRYREAPAWIEVFERELTAREAGERKEWMPCV